jgi:predicted cupin superfamily sugar epimerase
VAADEVWNLYRGDGLRLHIWDEAAGSLHTITLSSSTDTYCHVVPGGFWQAAEPLGTAVLVGCTVAPGFEFEDFELMDPAAESARALLASHPELTRFTVA